MSLEIVPETYPCLTRIVEAQLSVWPDHSDFLRKRFAGVDLGWAEKMAALVVRLAGDDLPRLADDYHWTCDLLTDELLHFRRTGEYRLTTFADALKEVYEDRAYMARYMNGLLLSQILWSNHTATADYYVHGFLATNAPGYRHLEIGPGHGLLLYFAAEDPQAASVTGWDLSAASVAATRHALTTLGARREALVVERDLLDPPRDGECFDSIVLSEVCEHLENPRAALSGLRRLLAPGGRIFINVPVNSPAPDHIYLLRSPEEAVDLVASCGFEIVESKVFPATGYSIERARKSNLTISCAIVAR